MEDVEKTKIQSRCDRSEGGAAEDFPLKNLSSGRLLAERCYI